MTRRCRLPLAITDIRAKNTGADFIAFLNTVNREVPADLDVHVISDNLATHRTPAVQRWLLRHRRFHFLFTPTYGSWMNLVDRSFSALTTKKLTRSAHRSLRSSPPTSKPSSAPPWRGDGVVDIRFRHDEQQHARLAP
jgi:transposase